MKKIKILPVLALILAVVFSAFTALPESTNATSQEYHWFEPDGTYQGFLSREEAEVLCPDGLNQVCLTPYSAISGNPGNEVPVGSPADDDIMKP